MTKGPFDLVRQVGQILEDADRAADQGRDPGIAGGIWVTSPEVQVLRKLDWYRSGGMASDRQWRDVVGILAAVDRLDTRFLLEAAGGLDLDGLPAEALEQTTPVPPVSTE